MAFLIYWSGRLAWADHLARAGDPAAIRLAPGDADIRLRLAGYSADALKAAAALDPGNADTWVRLGLAAEMRGDARAAESYMLEAARVSRQFAPRWTLASYYFRRGDRTHFWPWANEALAVGYGDLDALFELCWKMSPDGREIRALAVPDRAPVLNAYTHFLVRTGRLPASEPVAGALAAAATRDDLSTLSYWFNVQLDRGSVPAAVTVWNLLCTRHLLPYPPLDPNRAPLTDGDFQAPSPVVGGFAWRLPSVEGITAAFERQQRILRVEFNGNQPEACAPVMQYLPVSVGAAYRFDFEYRTAEIGPGGGLQWGVFDARTGTDVTDQSPWLSSNDWRYAEVRFHAPESGVARLTVVARRMPGQIRIAGSVELRGLAMERWP
jgi:hypothetical protein